MLRNNQCLLNASAFFNVTVKENEGGKKKKKKLWMLCCGGLSWLFCSAVPIMSSDTEKERQKWRTEGNMRNKRERARMELVRCAGVGDKRGSDRRGGWSWRTIPVKWLWHKLIEHQNHSHSVFGNFPVKFGWLDVAYRHCFFSAIFLWVPHLPHCQAIFIYFTEATAVFSFRKSFLSLLIFSSSCTTCAFVKNRCWLSKTMFFPVSKTFALCILQFISCKRSCC